MPTINTDIAEIRVWVHPIDPDAAFRSPCAVSIPFASLLSPDSGDSAGIDSISASFAPIEWQGQTALSNVRGPLQFVRLLQDGTVEMGARVASEANPQSETCGFTLSPTVTRLHSSIGEPALLPGSGDVDLRPRFPEGEPVLEWVGEQGEGWERELPLALPYHGGIRHRPVPANRTVKAKTKEKWPENTGFSVAFDFGGIAYKHVGQPALRFEWGGRYSLVLRGVGKDARPVLERRSSNAEGKVEWKVWRTLQGAPALANGFWRTRHEVTFYRLSGLLLFSWNGLLLWTGELDDANQLRPITWKESPLRVSVLGVDVLVQVSKLNFDLEAAFSSETPTAEPPALTVPFKIEGEKIHSFPAGPGRAQAKLHGASLEQTKLEATWELINGTGRVLYNVILKGKPEEAPLLCAFAAQFPPMATSLAKPPVDLRAALTQVEVESGQPETLPTAEARIGVSLPMLEKFVEDWELAILPYRPVHIEVDPAHDGSWETIFKGYLLPEGVSSDGYNTEALDLIARDPKIRLREPAALVDDLFGPLDLMQEDDGEDIFGAQCAQKLLGLQERTWATTFNGTGNAFTYFEPDHYPLKSGAGNSYFLATQTPETGGFH
ncbi:hypothetical protein EON80_10680, partial [bacterium]